MLPNQFGPHGQMVPQNWVPMDKWSTTNLVSMNKLSLDYSVFPGGQAAGIRKCRDQILGDHFSRGTEFDGDRLSSGIDLIGIVCLGGQEVGDWNFGDQIGSRPNALQPQKTHRELLTGFLQDMKLII